MQTKRVKLFQSELVGSLSIMFLMGWEWQMMFLHISHPVRPSSPSSPSKELRGKKHNTVPSRNHWVTIPKSRLRDRMRWNVAYDLISESVSMLLPRLEPCRAFPDQLRAHAIWRKEHDWLGGTSAVQISSDFTRSYATQISLPGLGGGPGTRC